MNARTAWTLLLALLLLGPAGSLHAQWRGTVRDSAGVQVMLEDAGAPAVRGGQDLRCVA